MLVRLGERGGLEESVAGEFGDVEFIRIVSGKIRRGASLTERIRNIGDMFVVVW
ncbi:hypothetical protein KBC03_00325 [Patescibacteria group bacterium]|nr:hypothetical protein [Patescibacteria group bacterium]